jgi:hypothetical protein
MDDDLSVTTYQDGEYLISSKARFADRHYFVNESQNSKSSGQNFGKFS